MTTITLKPAGIALLNSTGADVVPVWITDPSGEAYICGQFVRRDTQWVFEEYGVSVLALPINRHKEGA